MPWPANPPRTWTLRNSVHPMVHPTKPVSTLELCYVDYAMWIILCGWMLLAEHHLYISWQERCCNTKFWQAAKLLSGISPAFAQPERPCQKKESLLQICQLFAISGCSLANFSSTCDTASTEIVWKAGAMIEREYQAICWGHFCLNCQLCLTAVRRFSTWSLYRINMFLYDSMQFYMILYIIYSIRYH